MNDAGTQKYDNKGTCEAMLLTANDAGTQKYDNKGTCESFLGTSVTTTITPLRNLLGVGL